MVFRHAGFRGFGGPGLRSPVTVVGANVHGSDIPIAPAAIFLKSVRVSDLDATQLAAINFAFGRFFKEEQPNEFIKELNPEREAAEQRAGIVSRGQQAPFRYRRFAGGADLPRARYFTLCEDPAGNDHGTLLCEMLTYVDHERCGRFHAWDRAAGFASHGGPVAGASGALSAMTMEFLDDAQGESPFVRDLQAKGLIRVAETTRVEIPYRVQEVRIERSLDLRQPRAQAWLQQRVSKKGLPGALFEYATHASQRLTWLHPAADDGALSDPLESADGLSFNGVAITFGPCDSWDSSRYAGPDDFMGLLPYLIIGTRGGSPVTDAIGRWLRASGVEALIYPSARNDVACEVRGERLVRATGWNLVDYREAPAPDRSLFSIIEPDSWRFPSAPHGERVRRYDVQLPPKSSPDAGSFWVRDQADLLRAAVAAEQRMVEAGAQMRRALAQMWTQPHGLQVPPPLMDERRMRQCLDGQPELANLPYAVDQACSIGLPGQRIAALLDLGGHLRMACRRVPDSAWNNALHNAIAFLEWSLAFHVGSSALFNFQADPETRAEEAVRWLSAALDTPIRRLNAFEWARTQGELSTAYKNRLSGDPGANREAAMECLEQTLGVFLPHGERRQWLITIKQRAIVRLSAQQSAEEAGVEYERAIAELEMVVNHADPDAEFDVWSSACSALGTVYSMRHVGYFVQNGEKSIEILEKLLHQVGDLEAMMSRGSTLSKLNLAAATAVNLAGCYQGRRIGNDRTNRARALELLRPARKLFAALREGPKLELIDKRIAELEAEGAPGTVASGSFRSSVCKAVG